MCVCVTKTWSTPFVSPTWFPFKMTHKGMTGSKSSSPRPYMSSTILMFPHVKSDVVTGDERNLAENDA